MEKIKVRVFGNQIEVIECPAVITAGTVGLAVEFAFDSQWDALSKTVVFKAGDKVVATILESNTRNVPWEVLEKPNQWLCIGVYGANERGTVVIPTLWAKVSVIHTGVNPEGDHALDPTAPVWQNLLARVESISEVLHETYSLSCDNKAAIDNHKNNVDGENPHGVVAAQIGAAPAGYGLGEKATRAENWDAGFVNAFNRSNQNSPDGKWWYGITCREQSGTGTTTEIAFSVDSGNNVCEVRRSRNAASTWGGWEYVNPPMLPGVEYRTTQRWMGMPVYTQLLKCMVDAQSAYLDSPGFIIRANGCLANEDGIPFYPLPHGENAWLEIDSTAGIELIVNNPNAFNVLDTLAVQVWYIKT